MLNIVDLRAVIIRMLLTFITENTATVNAKIQNVINNMQPLGGSPVLWNRHGVFIILNKNDKGQVFMEIYIGESNVPSFSIKLGSEVNAINARVLNALGVWYHSQVRERKNHFDNVVENGIKQIDITPCLKDFSILDRLLGKEKEISLSTGNKISDELIETQVSLRRSITNNLSVVVSVSTKGLGRGRGEYVTGALETLFPVHHGVLKQFSARMGTDPVNEYIRQAIQDHLEHNLK